MTPYTSPEWYLVAMSTFVPIGFIAATLAILWLDEDLILDRLHRFVANRLARMGWRDIAGQAMKPRGGLGLIPRFLYALQDCEYCLSCWVAASATWFALHHGSWYAVFGERAWWLTWWGGTGVAWTVVILFKVGQRALNPEDDHVDAAV